MSANKNKRFAALPARAARDLRLGARHWRALAVITLHDQLDQNGGWLLGGASAARELVGVDETELSHLLTDLRAFGYVISTIDPTDRRRRIHGIVYNDADRTWRQDSWLPAQPFTCAPTQPSEVDSWENHSRYLGNSGEIVGKIESQNDPMSLQSLSENDRTYVQHTEHIKEEELIEGTDCAEARRQGVVREAREYLTTIETLAASKDRDSLRFERAALARLASDACLPEALNERAARLLSRIG